MHSVISIVKAGSESEARDSLRRRNEDSLLNGPQVKPESSDVVASQDQVDDLLDELGF